MIRFIRISFALPDFVPPGIPIHFADGIGSTPPEQLRQARFQAEYDLLESKHAPSN